MDKVEASIDVHVPVDVAYNQWTQFEDIPQFMEGVESVKQIDDTHLRWVAEVGGKKEEWTAEILRQIPDEVIEWRSEQGVPQHGIVRFQPLDDDRTRIDVSFEYEPQGLAESLGSKVGLDERRVKADLERLKELVESRGVPTGAWRGTVEQGEPR